MSEHEGTVEELLETLDLLAEDGEGWSIAGESARLLREQAARIAELEAQVPRIKANILRSAAAAWRLRLLGSDASYVDAEAWLKREADLIEKEARRG